MMVWARCLILWILSTLIALTHGHNHFRRNQAATTTNTTTITPTSWWYSVKTSMPTPYPTMQPTHPTYQPTGAPTSAPTKTPPAPLNLLVFGDWGKGGIYGDATTSASGYSNSKDATNTYQAPLARVMKTYYDYLAPRFRKKNGNGGGGSGKGVKLSAVLALGDNFYNDGVASTTDTLWTTMYTNVYLEPNKGASSSPLKGVPWYPVLGNHDYGSGSKGIDAQIQRTYSNNDDMSWDMPARNYTKILPIQGGGSVAIIFVDTTTLAPQMNKLTSEKGGVSTETQAILINNQIKCIEKNLKAAQAAQPSWLMVAGHYPIFSIGDGGGHGDSYELIQNLQPLLEKYQVDFFFCGHDHISEHLAYNNIHYFVAGAGALIDSAKGSSQANLRWVGAGYSAFAAVSATPTNFTVEYINVQGERVYSFTLTQPSNTIKYGYNPSKGQSGGSSGGSGGSGSRASNGGDDEMEKERDQEASRMNLSAVITGVILGVVVLTVVVALVVDIRMVGGGMVRVASESRLMSLLPTTDKQSPSLLREFTDSIHNENTHKEYA